MASTVSLKGLFRAGVDGLSRDPGAGRDLAVAVSQRFRADRVILTDSGTSALVLALRAATPKQGVVAIPGFACADLISAALKAEVRLRLYDTDPMTLSPDPASVDAVLARGVDVLVLVHLFGFPADTRWMSHRASEEGVTVIEDAAQGAGGRLDGAMLGSFGPLSLLSFGRGKGINGGGGGVLLVRDGNIWENLQVFAPEPTTKTDWRGLGVSLAQLVLGRPSLFRIPASLPFLRLGEMVFRPAGEPKGIGLGNARLALDAFHRIDAESRARREMARVLGSLSGLQSRDHQLCSPVEGGESGMLRLPLVTSTPPAPAFGILRPYPVPLSEVEGAAGLLMPGEKPGPGARLLAQNLLTLPTHRYLSRGDVNRIDRWANGLEMESPEGGTP